MGSVINGLSIILLLIYAFSIGYGVNLKKWNGWAQVLSGFVLGFLVGLGEDWIGSLITGLFFALLMMWLGPIMWRRRHL